MWDNCNSQKIKLKGNFSASKWDTKYVYHLHNRKEYCNESNVWNCNYSVDLELPEEIEKANLPLIREISDKNERRADEMREKEENGTLEQKDYDDDHSYSAEVEIIGSVKVTKMLSKFGVPRVIYIPEISVEEMKVVSPIKSIKFPKEILK